jgi:hypothetical protein
MNQRIFEQLARQRLAELQQRTPGSQVSPRRTPGSRHRLSLQRQSLRVRTGWTLVHVGLKLAIEADSGPGAGARPVRF